MTTPARHAVTAAGATLRTPSRTTSRAPELHQYPFVTWEALKPRINWKQGQHVLCVGGTGSGKSTLSGELLPKRDFVVVCVSKGKDSTLTGPYFRGYVVYDKWPPKKKDHKVMLWPPNASTIRETQEKKGPIFRKMFDDILLRQGGWCIDIDETHYMADTLKLSPEISDIMEQGRSHKITMWNNTQRPAGIPLSCYVNATHAFIFRSQEEADLDRLRRIVNQHTNARELQANIERLSDHEFVYIDRSGKVPPVRSMVKMKGRTK